MALTATRADRSRSGEVTARVSAALWRRAWLRATLTLTPPFAWFLVIYLASLVVMLVTAFWTVNPFTNTLEHTWTLANFRQLLFTAVLLPLWASYLARVYAWIVILQKGGTLSWLFEKAGLGAVNIGYTNTAMWLVFSYIWLPFMIVPVYGAFEAA